MSWLVGGVFPSYLWAFDNKEPTRTTSVVKDLLASDRKCWGVWQRLVVAMDAWLVDFSGAQQRAPSACTVHSMHSTPRWWGIGEKHHCTCLNFGQGSRPWFVLCTGCGGSSCLPSWTVGCTVTSTHHAHAWVFTSRISVCPMCPKPTMYSFFFFLLKACNSVIKNN